MKVRPEGSRVSAAHRLRRVFDMAFAIFGLCILSPLFCAIAIAIKMDDGGPIFYRQLRMGRRFRTFRIIKFRTMIENADRLGLLTTSVDIRITRIGNLLRRYKLDELPQLLNVLKGDMQFVGARPEVPKYVEMFRAEYEQILQERPGITDPASIAYRREGELLSTPNAEEQYITEILPAKLKLTLEYQGRRNLLSDLRLIFRTLSVVTPD